MAMFEAGDTFTIDHHFGYSAARNPGIILGVFHAAPRIRMIWFPKYVTDLKWTKKTCCQPEVWQFVFSPLKSDQKKQWQDLCQPFFSGPPIPYRSTKPMSVISPKRLEKSTIWRMLFSIENGHFASSSCQGLQGFFAPENGWLEDDSSPKSEQTTLFSRASGGS